MRSMDVSLEYRIEVIRVRALVMSSSLLGFGGSVDEGAWSSTASGSAAVVFELVCDGSSPFPFPSLSSDPPSGGYSVSHPSFSSADVFPDEESVSAALSPPDVGSAGASGTEDGKSLSVYVA